MPKVPDSDDNQQAAGSLADHDNAGSLDGLDEITLRIPVVSSQLVELLLPANYVEALKQVARRKGMPYQMLIQMWLVQKLREDAPDLLPH